MSKKVRGERLDGDGRERGDGDGGGGGGERGKHSGGGAFVFGSGGAATGCKDQTVGSKGDDRRPVSISYREKLLSPGGLGFLVSHEEADDIVSGWKGFFAKECSESEMKKGGDAEAGSDEEMGGASGGRYPVLSITSDQYTTWCKPWMNSLIIKVLGLSVPRHVLIDRVRRMWKPKQPLKVVPLSNEYYIVSFSSKEDRDYAYYEGDHYLLVQRWRPNFNPKKADCQRRVAVWVRIPDLPLEFCTVESLGIIGNMIGKMIKIDRSTSIYDKGAFARICVEVDLHKPLLPAFTVFGEDKQLVYEGLHLVCFSCGKYGHAQENCVLKNKVAGETLLVNIGEPSGEKADEARKGGPEDSGSNTLVENNSGIGVGVDGGWNTVESGKAKVVAGESRTVVESTPINATGSSGGGNHLGPQMIFRRDWRKSADGVAGYKGVAKIGGCKNGEVAKKGA
ncbi:hypothetical protein K1719_004446 [Acacia pycnantha]|nr:hypothetical protein K1719_004446 [Acacia pycnantha]